MKLTSKHVGWTLLIAGAGIELMEASAQADATLKNTAYSDSLIGGIVSPVEKYLPVTLGWSLIIAGAVVIWLVPYIKKVA